eukprot:m.183767 g.183767  ORF g.183767 m.183767 type:complete len:1212 (-) comp24671_c0_seq2:55-3690(-)
MADGPRKPLMIGGISVNFPFKPYPSQLMMMSGAIKALSRKESAVLESPTGSGKTMSLLCATLAWQRNEAANLDAIHRVDVLKPEAAAPAPVIAPSRREVEPKMEPVAAPVTIPATESTSEHAEGALDATKIESRRRSKQPRVALCDDGSDDDDDFKPPSTRTPSGHRKSKRSRRSTDSNSSCSRGTPLSTESDHGFDGNEAGPAKQASSKVKTTKAPRPPKIFFGTRTHKQITQVVKELRQSGYGKTTRMCVLASREHTCVHPQVSKASNKNEECSKLHNDMAQGGPGCSFFRNMHSLSFHPSLKPYGKLAVWDIEDLVKLGKKVKGCGYYASREMLEGADIVFAPYNYLIDPVIRKSMGIDVTDSVIIIDEAHNIEDSARESASLTLPTDTLRDTVTELSVAFAVSADDPGLSSLVSVTTAVLAWIDATGEGFSSDGRAAASNDNFDSASKIITGRQAAVVFETFGITKVTVAPLQQHLDEILTAQAEASADPMVEPTLGARTVGTLKSLLLVLGFLLCGGDTRLEDYKVVVERKSALVEREGKTSRELQLSVGFWCLNPAVAYKSMADDARTVILTSGTMSPLDTFSSELGSTFPHTIEANHVIKSDQVWAGTLASAESGRKLQLTYRDVDTFTLQDDVGAVVLRTCKVVPSGVLVFAPSYALLDKFVTRWKTTGLWKELSKLKVVVVEPKGGSKSDFEGKLKKFYNAIKAVRTRKAKHTGGLFLAVVRGKVSEGLDFADDNARAVISLGIPFPNARDQNVLMKKEYNSKWSKKNALMNGDQWYETQAFRALNQGLGRCIRHRDDWGAILIVDCRFATKERYTAAISKWVRQRLVHHGKFDKAMASLEEFVARRVKCDAGGVEDGPALPDPPSIPADADAVPLDSSCVTTPTVQGKISSWLTSAGPRRAVPRVIQYEGSPRSVEAKPLVTEATPSVKVTSTAVAVPEVPTPRAPIIEAAEPSRDQPRHPAPLVVSSNKENREPTLAAPSTARDPSIHPPRTADPLVECLVPAAVAAADASGHPMLGPPLCVPPSRPRKRKDFEDGDADEALVCQTCGDVVLCARSKVLSDLRMTSHVLGGFLEVFGGSGEGCAVGGARVLVVSDRGALKAKSQLDEVGGGEHGLNAIYVPQDEALFGVLRCPTKACSEIVGLDRVSCRHNTREAWLSTKRTCSIEDSVVGAVDMMLTPSEPQASASTASAVPGMEVDVA